MMMKGKMRLVRLSHNKEAKRRMHRSQEENHLRNVPWVMIQDPSKLVL
jgi:hypothetical protein